MPEIHYFETLLIGEAYMPAQDWEIYKKYRKFALGNALQIWRAQPGWWAGDYQLAAENLHALLSKDSWVNPTEPGTRDAYAWVREQLVKHFDLTAP